MLTAACTLIALAFVAPAALYVADWYCRLITPPTYRMVPRPVLTPLPRIPPVPARRTATGQQACRLELS